MGSYSTLAEQLFELWVLADQEKYVGDDWTFSFGELGSFVGVLRQHAQEMILSWKKGQDCGRYFDRGAPKSLSLEQEHRILEYVKGCDQNLFPLTQATLIQWVNESFGTDLSLAWLSIFIRHQKSLSIVEGMPMEEARAMITVDGLKENASTLNAKVALAHPHLILNIDETGLDCSRDDSKLKLVSSSPTPRCYMSP